MQYIADLHLHSHYSRATSKNLTLESLYQWARIKGIHVVATGDFTHPGWRKELEEKLQPDGSGLYTLKNPPKVAGLPGVKTKDIPVKFCLTSEISSIYKFDEKVRKNHNLVFAPDFETAGKISNKLAEIGNLSSDGRPILGLPARDLLEIVLETSDNAHLIPAHVWTPWFSTLGSKAGYNSIEACFRDLSAYIFALETGLSSDPEMNWRVSSLDRYTLISNSDAHSPQKLGREATLFNTEFSYDALFHALKTKEGYEGTYEFFPEEGKYHVDGHRKCGISLMPQETLKYNKRCPACGKPLTIGVLHRVEELSDRDNPLKPENYPGYQYIIPLPEILSEIMGTGPSTKSVNKSYIDLINTFGNEFTLLRQVPVEEIEKKSNPLVSEAIRRVREHRVKPVSGYDGEFGKINVFTAGEIEKLLGQTDIFGGSLIESMALRTVTRLKKQTRSVLPAAHERKDLLNDFQLKAVKATGNVLVTAGPGTGKTKTLVSKVIEEIQTNQLPANQVMVITFTNKAANEVRARFIKSLGKGAEHIRIGTFHAIAYGILKESDPEQFKTVYDAKSRQIIFHLLYPEITSSEIQTIAKAFENYFEFGQEVDARYSAYFDEYLRYVRKHQGVDLVQIIPQAIQYLSKTSTQGVALLRFLALDELQDINPVQYEFIKVLGSNATIFAIGDPNQSIYGFRGSDLNLFYRFQEEFNAREITLEQNYRNSKAILKPALELIQQNDQFSDYPALCIRGQGNPINYFQAQNIDQEVDFIIRMIYEMIGGVDNLSYGKTRSEHNYAYSDIAILYRTHSAGALLLDKLKQAGIPSQYSDGTNLLNTPPFSTLVHILRYLINPTDMVALINFGMEKLGFSSVQAFTFARLYQESRVRADAFLEKNIHLKQAWETWITFQDEIKPLVVDNKISALLQVILTRYFPASVLNESDVARLELLIDLSKKTEDTLEQFILNMLFTPYLQPAGYAGGGVNLLTYHASKGLEFPVVFLPAMEEGISPIDRKDVDMNEERRLLFVAMTRASDHLFLSSSEERRIFGQNRRQRVSRFLSDCLLNYTIPAKLPDKYPPKSPDTQLSLF